MLTILGTWLLPLITGTVIAYALINKQPVFAAFLEGGNDGIKTAFKLLPSIIGLVTAVEMLKASGALDIMTGILSPVAELLGFPPETVSLMLIHPVSGSGSTAIFNNIMQTCGTESLAGRVAAVMCGSGETTFYAVMIYFGATGVKKMRHTIFAALAADFAAAAVSVIGVKIFFGS